MRRETIEANGLSFSCLVAGPEAAPLLLFLHGFPEYSGAWSEMLERLSDRFFCVAPDQRGYNLSSKPEGVAAYSGGRLAADALAVLDRYRPGEPAAAVIGHDWGASVAYALAFRAPERMRRLVILNGVHPIPFQRALAAGGAQSEASQYIDWLRRDGSEAALAENGFARMTRMFSANMDLSWLEGRRLEEYRRAWGRPGALTGMVNWYRASPVRVARPGEPLPPGETPDFPAELMRVKPPHLLLWGMRDAALLPDSRDGLVDLCDDLTVREFPEADHWIAHQRPDEVAHAIADFAG